MRPAPPSVLRTGALLATVLLAVITSAPGPASAAPRPEGPTGDGRASAPAAAIALAQPSPDLPGLPPVSSALSRIRVDSPAFRR
ncbi:MAG: hypothetical protein ABIY48_10670, partial [Acidimicrobiales bacterium]